MWVCQRCGKEFLPKNMSKSHLLQRPPKYCSLQCGRKWRQGGGFVACTQCGKEIYRRKSHIALTRRPFCGFPCYGEWQKNNPPETRDDLRLWSRQRLLALDRDNHQCVDCGQTEKRLVVHHIQERTAGVRDNHQLDNLISLCGVCHRKRHTSTSRVPFLFALPKINSERA